MTLFLFVVVMAILFEYINGFHDAANAIATVVSTKVLTPRQAIGLAAFFNLTGALAGTAVAATIGKGMVDTNVVTIGAISCALLGAIVWNLITWFFGLPTSSSHALIGGYAGAAIARAGTDVIIVSGWYKTIAYIFLSPIIGMALGLGLMVAVSWIFMRQSPYNVDRWFRRLQLASAAAFSFAHGTNDAQKTMGIIAGA